MQATGETWRLGHMPALDGLRGVAILLVIVSHIVPAGNDIRNLGPAGVTLFFTLSGFLITSLLLQEHTDTGRVSLRGFYLRRARRLFPALIVMVGLVGLFQWVLGGSLRALPGILLYVGNWLAVDGAPMGLMKHTWSLSVEEQFYVIWPLAVLACLRWGTRRLVLEVALLGALVSFSAGVYLWDSGAGVARVAYGSDTRAYALLAGCALAAWMHGRKASGRSRPMLGWAMVGTAAGVALVPGVWSYAVLTPGVTAIAGVVALWALSQGDGTGGFGHQWLVFAGRRSYGWYLWHAPVYSVAAYVAGERSPAAVAVGTVVFVGIAEFSWRFVEEPFLRRSVGQRPRRTLSATYRA